MCKLIQRAKSGGESEMLCGRRGATVSGTWRCQMRRHGAIHEAVPPFPNQLRSLDQHGGRCSKPKKARPVAMRRKAMSWVKESTAWSSACPGGAERTVAASDTFDTTDQWPVASVAAVAVAVADAVLGCEGVVLGVEQNVGQGRRLPCRYPSPLHRCASPGGAAPAAGH